ncbi:hypothetical protein BSKO_13266 [Bryopsis sp. KO-2023]|nr:hypothetical protein BSKO_13266 [Bryopsis sp. KO-2023]
MFLRDKMFGFFMSGLCFSWICACVGASRGLRALDLKEMQLGSMSDELLDGSVEKSLGARDSQSSNGMSLDGWSSTSKKGNLKKAAEGHPPSRSLTQLEFSSFPDSSGFSSFPDSSEFPSFSSSSEFPAGFPSTSEFPSSFVSTSEFPAGFSSSSEFPAGFPSTSEFPAGFPSSSEFPAGFPSTSEFPAGFPSTSEFPAGFPSTSEFPASFVSSSGFQDSTDSSDSFPFTASSLVPDFSESSDSLQESDFSESEVDTDGPGFQQFVEDSGFSEAQKEAFNVWVGHVKKSKKRSDRDIILIVCLTVGPGLVIIIGATIFLIKRSRQKKSKATFTIQQDPYPTAPPRFETPAGGR